MNKSFESSPVELPDITPTKEELIVAKHGRRIAAKVLKMLDQDKIHAVAPLSVQLAALKSRELAFGPIGDSATSQLAEQGHDVEVYVGDENDHTAAGGAGLVRIAIEAPSTKEQ